MSVLAVVVPQPPLLRDLIAASVANELESLHYPSAIGLREAHALATSSVLLDDDREKAVENGDGTMELTKEVKSEPVDHPDALEPTMQVKSEPVDPLEMPGAEPEGACHAASALEVTMPVEEKCPLPTESVAEHFARIDETQLRKVFEEMPDAELKGHVFFARTKCFVLFRLFIDQMEAELGLQDGSEDWTFGSLKGILLRISSLGIGSCSLL